MQKIITVSQLATVLWQFLYLSLKPNNAQILSSRISWRRRSRISTTLVLVCIHLIFWLGYVEIWRHGNFSLLSIFCEFSEIRRSENQLYESTCPMGPVNSLRRNLQLENANQGTKKILHIFLRMLSLQWKSSSIWEEKR